MRATDHGRGYGSKKSVEGPRSRVGLLDINSTGDPIDSVDRKPSPVERPSLRLPIHPSERVWDAMGGKTAWLITGGALIRRPCCADPDSRPPRAQVTYPMGNSANGGKRGSNYVAPVVFTGMTICLSNYYLLSSTDE